MISLQGYGGPRVPKTSIARGLTVNRGKLSYLVAGTGPHTTSCTSMSWYALAVCVMAWTGRSKCAMHFLQLSPRSRSGQSKIGGRPSLRSLPPRTQYRMQCLSYELILTTCRVAQNAAGSCGLHWKARRYRGITPKNCSAVAHPLYALCTPTRGESQGIQISGRGISVLPLRRTTPCRRSPDLGPAGALFPVRGHERRRLTRREDPRRDASLSLAFQDSYTAANSTSAAPSSHEQTVVP